MLRQEKCFQENNLLLIMKTVIVHIWEFLVQTKSQSSHTTFNWGGYVSHRSLDNLPSNWTI